MSQETTKYRSADAPVLSAQDARQGKSLGHIRYVLIFSVGIAAIAAIAGVVIWLAFFG
jgi:hypothetical protein